ncbi:MAG: hypothetical protein ABJF01_17595 [bacterium]
MSNVYLAVCSGVVVGLLMTLPAYAIGYTRGRRALRGALKRVNSRMAEEL